ncbi:hypothetical protein C4K05_4570 [Pseudomonas chlororaphis subsp. aureofaciens]|nr:hypothetical protein C4K06_4478 [Pseudomonas chlororaphis subsp. aureofaciens]AZE43896.1 hypothetical protein C4K05_4570 [Pseudomonas chlororaphis subsp. aureofaciens]
MKRFDEVIAITYEFRCQCCRVLDFLVKEANIGHIFYRMLVP